MLNYVEFLLERIEVGDNLEKKLKSVNSKFTKELKAFLDKEEIEHPNIVKIDYDNDDKVLTIYDKKGGERKIKVGKLLKSLNYDKEVKGYEIENFVDYLKKSKDENNFKLLSGRDISKAYLCTNYESGKGSLNYSCMRHEHTNDYLEIYYQNPNVVQCLTLYNDEGKVRGRALLWKMTNGKLFLDRIYVSDTKYRHLFIEYAEKNGYETSEPSADVKLDVTGDYDYYPYVDTFRYYTPTTGIMSPDEGDLYLISQTGGTSTAEGPDGLVWSNHLQEDIPRDEAEKAYNSKGEVDWVFSSMAVEVIKSDKYNRTDYGIKDESALQLAGDSDVYVLYFDKEIYSDTDWGIHLIADKLPKKETYHENSPELYCLLVKNKESNYDGYYVPIDRLYKLYEDGRFIYFVEGDEVDEEVIYNDDDYIISFVNYAIQGDVCGSLIQKEWCKLSQPVENGTEYLDITINDDAPIYFDIDGQTIRIKDDSVIKLANRLYLKKDHDWVDRGIIIPNFYKIVKTNWNNKTVEEYGRFISNKYSTFYRKDFPAMIRRGNDLIKSMPKFELEVFDDTVCEQNDKRKLTPLFSKLIDIFNDAKLYYAKSIKDYPKLASVTSHFIKDGMYIFPYISKGDKFLAYTDRFKWITANEFYTS